MRTLVLGLGNTILTDDGVGIRVALEIKKLCSEPDVLEASAAGFRVIDDIVGYEKLILIDSIKTGNAKPGTLFKFTLEDFEKTFGNTSPHDISLFDALKVAKANDEDLPSEYVIYGIEAKETQVFSEECTPEVEAAIPGIVKRIIEEQKLR
jgi:hydrogenase maturation protease